MMPHSKLYKIILSGKSSTGKSNVLSKYVNKQFNQKHIPTIGVQFFAKTITVDQTTIKLQIWDTSGSQKFKSITTSYYNGGNIILFVFDLTSAESFMHVKKQIGQKFNMLRDKNSDCTAVLVGNKMDLEGRQVSLEEAQKVGQLVGRYIQTSAKTSENIDQLFIQATKDKLNCDNKVANQFSFVQNVKNIIECKTLQELGNQYSQFQFNLMSYLFSNPNPYQTYVPSEPVAPGDPSPILVQTKPQQSEEEYKIVKLVLSGSQKTGKTTIFSNYLFQKPVQQYQTTIGVDFGVRKVKLDDKCYKLQVWDTAGQERFKVIISGYLIKLVVAFVVFDKTNPASFQNAKSLIQEIKEKNQNPYICLVGNKNDLQQKVTYQDGIKLSEQMKVDFIEICANKLENVENLFARAIKVVHENNLVG